MYKLMALLKENLGITYMHDTYNTISICPDEGGAPHACSTNVHHGGGNCSHFGVTTKHGGAECSTTSTGMDSSTTEGEMINMVLSKETPSFYNG